MDARARVRIELVESGVQVDLRGVAATRLAAAVEAAIQEASRELTADGLPATGRAEEIEGKAATPVRSPSGAPEPR